MEFKSECHGNPLIPSTTHINLAVSQLPLLSPLPPLIIKTFQRTGTGVDGVDGEDVQDPARRQDIEIVMTRSLREASN